MPIKPENRSKYPKDWREISLRIRARANNRCEICGVPNGVYIVRNKQNKEQWVIVSGHEFIEALPPDAVKVVLTVAHMNHDETDCSDDNLKALCQRCHLAYDAQHHASNAAITRAAKKEAEAKKAGQTSLF